MVEKASLVCVTLTSFLSTTASTYCVEESSSCCCPCCCCRTRGKSSRYWQYCDMRATPLGAKAHSMGQPSRINWGNAVQGVGYRKGMSELEGFDGLVALAFTSLAFRFPSPLKLTELSWVESAAERKPLSDIQTCTYAHIHTDIHTHSNARTQRYTKAFVSIIRI